MNSNHHPVFFAVFISFIYLPSLSYSMTITNGKAQFITNKMCPFGTYERTYECAVVLIILEYVFYYVDFAMMNESIIHS